ncbi:hypothetical protein MMC07_003377 [Pseudocyphellaria aurata]|nr:hypothetical protein [Pseudocyphellaria aurata]
MRTNEKLEDDEILFKAIEEEETWMKVEQKASANFAKPLSKSQGTPKETKKKFTEWPKCKKCGCKHLPEVTCRHADKTCDKCHKKGHISRFHDNYTAVNKSSSNSYSSTTDTGTSKTKSVTCVTQVSADKMTGNTRQIRKIIADSDTTQHLTANRDLIQNYYDDSSEYETGSGEALPSYGKGFLHLPAK